MYLDLDAINRFNAGDKFSYTVTTYVITSQVIKSVKTMGVRNSERSNTKRLKRGPEIPRRRDDVELRPQAVMPGGRSVSVGTTVPRIEDLAPDTRFDEPLDDMEEAEINAFLSGGGAPFESRMNAS